MRALNMLAAGDASEAREECSPLSFSITREGRHIMQGPFDTIRWLNEEFELRSAL
jgi:hypothetical protein